MFGRTLAAGGSRSARSISARPMTRSRIEPLLGFCPMPLGFPIRPALALPDEIGDFANPALPVGLLLAGHGKSPRSGLPPPTKPAELAEVPPSVGSQPSQKGGDAAGTAMKENCFPH